MLSGEATPGKRPRKYACLKRGESVRRRIDRDTPRGEVRLQVMQGDLWHSIERCWPHASGCCASRTPRHRRHSSRARGRAAAGAPPPPGEDDERPDDADNPLQLGEIVVTGAGTVSEVEKLGTGRSSVDSLSIVRSAEPNVVAALAAKAPPAAKPVVESLTKPTV